MKILRSFLLKTALISAVFFISYNFAFAEVDKIVFVNEPQTIVVNEFSEKYTVRLIDENGTAATSSNTIYVTLPETDFEFYSTTEKSKADKGDVAKMMDSPSAISRGDSNKYFHIKSSKVGEFTIKIIAKNAKDGTETKTWEVEQVVKVVSSASELPTTGTGDSTGASSGSSGGVSSHAGAETVSTYKEPTGIFEVSAGRERVVYVGTPVFFAEKHKASSELASQYQTYSWSLGDGARKEGAKVEHIYKFPGDHIVVLNATCGQYSSVARTVVKVVAPELVLNTLPGGFEIENKGKYEINLGGWKIETLSGTFTIPQDTIIAEKKKIVIPFEYANIKENEITFFSIKDTRGVAVAQYQKVDPVLASAEIPVQKVSFVQPEIRERVVINTTQISPVENISIVTSTAQVSTGTAIVATTSGQGIIKKIINLPVTGIKAVKDTFYESE